MITFPNAKINIGLFVTEKRPDGYHNLETIFYPIPLCDVLEIVPIDNGVTHLNISGLEVPGNVEDNLVLKAYYLLKKDFDIPEVAINLHKLIPMGGGLGGGSADAAFCLLNLNRQFELNLTKEQLLDYALQLGSDCPFFINNSPQYAEGRGELMEDINLDLSGKYLVMVFPGVHVSTAQAFGGLSPKPSSFNLRSISNIEIDDYRDVITNDFETSIFNIHPRLKEIKESLMNMGADFALMSGSGSSIYGIFPSKPNITCSDIGEKYVTLEL